MPKMTISISEQERERLERLAERWGVKPSRAIALAVIHAAASLEAGEPIHTIVPKELTWADVLRKRQ